MTQFQYPHTQGELIRRARAGNTQAQFAHQLGVDRTCLSRYESESLGAPTAVINACLRTVANQLNGADSPKSDNAWALEYARKVVHLLEPKPVRRASAYRVSK